MTQFLMKMGFVILIMLTNPKTGVFLGILFVIGALSPRPNRWGLRDSSASWIAVLLWGLFPVLFTGTTFTMAVLVLGCIAGFIHARVELSHRADEIERDIAKGGLYGKS